MVRLGLILVKTFGMEQNKRVFIPHSLTVVKVFFASKLYPEFACIFLLSLLDAIIREIYNKNGQPLCDIMAKLLILQ